METEVSDLPESSSGAPKKDTVAYETYQKVLAQRKKDQAENEALAAKLREFEAKEARLEEEKLKGEGNWKALVESRDLRLKAVEDEKAHLTQRLEQSEKVLNDAVKLNAFQSKLGGKLKKSDYLSFVDTSKIPINPETGQVDDASVEKYAHEFSNNYKELIDFQKSGSLPGGAGASPKDLSYAQWLKLPLAEKKARLKDVKK